MKYKLGVLGKGISYSLSPEIHNSFSKQSNIDIEYKIYDIEKDSLSFIENFFKNADICINLVGILFEQKKGNTFKNIHTVFPSILSFLITSTFFLIFEI